jgi:DNA polymerase-3 subunit alpha
MNEIDSVKNRYKSLTTLPMAFRILVIDTETSGLPKNRSASPKQFDQWPRIVQVGAILYKCTYKGRPGRILQRYSTIIRPRDWEIEEGAMKVHGITNTFAKENGKEVEEVLADIQALASKAHAICCHNVKFDISVILAEYYRANLIDYPRDVPFGSLPHICTMEIGKKLCRMLTEGTRKNGDQYLYYKSPKLSEMYEHMFGEPFDGKYHDALGDCEATVKVLDRLTKDHVPFLRVASPQLFRYE